MMQSSEKYKLVSYALLSDITAFTSLIMKNDILKITLFFSTHSLASAIMGFVIYRYLLPKKYRQPKIIVLLFVFIFNFFIPFFSYAAFFVFHIITKTNKKEKDVPLQHIDIDKLLLIDNVQNVKRFFGEGAVYTYITNKNLNPQLRLKAFLIVSDIISPQTIKFLNMGLSDPIDEIRLLSFSIINNLEKKTNDAIFKIKTALEKEKRDDEVELKLQLAKLNWELIYLNLVDDTFQEILIQNILKTLEGIDKKDAKMLLIKIYLLKKDYKKLELLLNSMEITNETVPYFLEISFYKKDYKRIEELIKKYPDIRFIEKFYFIYRLWNDN